MNNLEIYKKTLGFSLRRIFWKFLSAVLLPGLGLLPPGRELRKGGL